MALLVMALLPANAPAFPDRAIGITLFSGIDPWYRNRLYSLAVLAGLALSLAAFLQLRPGRGGAIIPAEYRGSLLPLLAALAVLNTLLALAGDRASPFAGGALLALCWLALRLVYPRLGAATSDSRFLLHVAAAWQFVSCLALGSGLLHGGLFLLLWLALSLLFLWNSQVWISQLRGSRLHTAMWPPLRNWMLLSPLLLYLAGEFSHGSGMPPALFFALFSAAVWVWSLLPGRPLALGAAGAALCVLLTTVIANEYSPQVVYRHAYDLFHLGERVLPLQQWHSFGALPFVDYLPVHGLFDLLPQMVYQTLHGSSFLESQFWGNGYFFGWLMRALAVWISWAFLRRLVRTEAAFLLLWLLPGYHLFEPYYVLLLLPALHVYSRLPTLRWWLGQWLLTLALLLWRPDFGLAVMLANLCLAAVLAWYRNRWSIILIALSVGLLVAILALALFLALAGVSGGLQKLQILAAYLQFQVPIASTNRFYQTLDWATLMQYAVLPATTVLVAGRCLAQIVRRQSVGLVLRLDMLLVFLAAISLILSLRALQRHTLLEGLFQHYFYLAVVLVFALRLLLPLRASAVFHTALAGVITLLYLAVPAVDSQFMQALYRHHPQWQYPLPAGGRSWPTLRHEAGRLRDSSRGHQAVVRFLRRQLEPGETFFDFSNAHMLYALVDVPLPVYVTQTIYQSSDTVQRATVRQLRDWHRQKRLPFVVFRQNTAWDRVDGIDNALRSYRVAEFIYRHFQPCVQTGQFELWLDRRRPPAVHCQPGGDIAGDGLQSITEKAVDQFIDFGHLPRLWSRADRHAGDSAELNVATPAGAPVSSSVQSSPGDVPLNVATLAEPSVSGSVQSSSAGGVPLHVATPEDRHWRLTGFVSGSCQPCYLDLEISSRDGGRLLLGLNGEKRASLVLSPGTHHYRIRLSALWHWHYYANIEAISLRAEQAAQIHAARLLSPLPS